MSRSSKFTSNQKRKCFLAQATQNQFGICRIALYSVLFVISQRKLHSCKMFRMKWSLGGKENTKNATAFNIKTFAIYVHMLLFNCFEIQFEFNLVFNSVYLYMLLEFQHDPVQLFFQLSDITCSQSFNQSPITCPLGSIQFTFAQRGFYFYAPEKSFAESSKEVFNTARVHIESTPDSIVIVYKLCKLNIQN